MKMAGLNKRGVTLVELTITVAVAGLLMYGMTTSMGQQIEGSVQMRDYLASLNLARMKMAEVRAGAYPATGTTTLSSESSLPGYMSQSVVTNVINSSGRTVRKVQIDVAKSTGSFSNPIVRLITYVTSVTTFGDGL